MPLPSLHDIGGHFIGCDVLKHGGRIAMGGQPMLCSLAVFGEMDEFAVVAGAVEDTATANRRTFDDGEHQVRVQRERAMDTDGDHTATAIVAFVQREARCQDDVSCPTLILPANQPAAAVAGLPCGELLAMALRWAWLAVRPG